MYAAHAFAPAQSVAVTRRGFRVVIDPPVAPPPPGLVVDLGQDVGSRRWWRGVATLAGLLGALAVLAPSVAPLPGGRGEALARDPAAEWAASGVGPSRLGSASGRPMAAGAQVVPLPQAPQRASLRRTLVIGANENLPKALVRAGAAIPDIGAALRALQPLGPVATGTPIDLTLGAAGPDGRRALTELVIVPDAERRATLRASAGGGFTLALDRKPVDTRPLRVSGEVGPSLYWSLRGAGVSPATAATYLKLIAEHHDVGALAPGDRFDLVVENRRVAGAAATPGALLLAALTPRVGAPVRLMQWNVGGRAQWLDETSATQPVETSSGLGWPVAGRITSSFGARYHPILRFLRMHKGLDFGAPAGAPIMAAADGQVTRAGWAGGYGRQVRLAHAEGLATSYSHMSAIAVAPGTMVRRGQVIGYVGSSGLSTGPHLHYEVLRGGVAIDPAGVRMAAARPLLDRAGLAAFRAKFAQLLQSPGA